MSFPRTFALLFGFASLLPAAQRPEAPDSFESWVNRLTADWIRDPAAADSDAGAGSGEKVKSWAGEGGRAARPRGAGAPRYAAGV